MSTLREILREGKRRLEEASISPIDAELLLAHLLGVGRMELHSRHVVSDETMNEEQWQDLKERFDELISERIDSIPVQYLTGEASFRHLTLAVGPGVLIPRPETEGLVELALQWIERESSVDFNLDEMNSQGSNSQDRRRFSVVDLGSGSGAIAISIAVECSERGIPVSVVAVEDSNEAKHWLERNIATYLERYPDQLDIRLVALPVSEALQGVKCDLVIANPPYIPNEFRGRLPSDVRNEPERALFGGESGIETPLHFATHAARLLKSGGALFMEHFEEQGQALANALAKPLGSGESAEFDRLVGHDDLAGRGRYISARKR